MNTEFYKSFSSHKSNKKTGFTLAEVLITLGIIGVVAALTIPTLIQKQTNAFTEASLKKFYSTFNQAIKASVEENGDMTTWESMASLTVSGWMDKYIVPYMKVIDSSKTVIEPSNNREYRLYTLADGSAFSWGAIGVAFYPKNAENCTSIVGSYGGYGTCAFLFNLSYETNSITRGCPHIDDDEPLYSSSYSYEACPARGDCCVDIIMRNGWKIPDNYPRKIKY